MAAIPLRKENESAPGTPEYLERIRSLFGQDNHSRTHSILSIPFSLNDTTAGSENELQSIVVGRKEDVDLPISIEESSYYRNMIRRMKSGETPRKVVCDLTRYITENKSRVWDNSWVRFPRRLLSPYANQVFGRDLLLNKKDSRAGRRGDIGRFFFSKGGEDHLRVPVSYLLKLSIADAISSQEVLPVIRSTGERAMGHFLNDNTSPEVFSFHPVLLKPEKGMGFSIARETLRRFLFTQLLVMYANKKFRLLENGQRAMVYFSPHPPVRQKHLNEIIPDSFYRDLFMNPCLSGWDHGEDKYNYMNLCHQVLSRSQLNAVLKLKESGIITKNLVVLPSISNISLANNGTHISIGSRRLTGLLKDRTSDFTPEDEKYLGDLVIKITEHFLPLFVGTYSACPYRLDFKDFHPERVLGFLPHELDFTHLRMMWRRWKKKADLQFMGIPVTPFGPRWLDAFVSSIFSLRGDFVPDFRLADYLACLLSTDESAGLDGKTGNDARLKKDLASMGIFHEKMSLYLLYKLREFSTMGFSGFEGRYYSLFPNLLEDMGHAASLQTLITALAYKYILKGEVTHAHIPDNPSLESERRQIFFGSALGIPTFFVRKDTASRFMLRVLAKTKRTRASNRYPGYIRVYNDEYRKALLAILKEDASDLIEILNLKETMTDLEIRLTYPDMTSAASLVTYGILQEVNSLSPMDLTGDEFNQAAESYYRGTLHKRHITEGHALLKEEVKSLERDPHYTDALRSIIGKHSAAGFVESIKADLLNERLSEKTIRKLIHILLLTIHHDKEEEEHAASVCG
jgi:hypothetical protein